jgi:hypothetical protein
VGRLARPKDAWLALAAGAIALAVYLTGNPGPSSYDSAPNSLLAFNLFENQRLDFDRFRGGFFDALHGGYAFVEAPSGRLTSLFPVGTAIVTLPIYGAFEVVRRASGDVPPITSPAFEPLRRQYERIAAALVAALSVALFFLCAREITDTAGAATTTVVYGFATSMWSTASQALWQHGPVNLFVLAVVYALFRAVRARAPAPNAAWLAAAGCCAGLLPVIRPTAILFTIAAAIFAGLAFRARGWWFGAALAAGLAPGIAWNVSFFHALLGGYATNARAYDFAPGHALAALAALLVSPSRGLFIFSPVLVFAIAGAVRLRRVRDPNASLVALLGCACAVLVVQYAFFRYWWAGFAYGPRFLTDIAAVGALLVAYALPAKPRSFAAAAFALTLAFSIAVQFAGIASGPAGSDWNAVPVSIDREPERVWPVADNQIARNLRATWVRFFAWDVARSPAYRRGLHVDVVAFADGTATIGNAGRSRVYGYDSGVYVGQMRVRVRIVDARGRVAPDGELYVLGSPSMGERATASGALATPFVPGIDRLECDVVLVGEGLEAPGESAAATRKNRCTANAKEVVP